MNAGQRVVLGDLVYDREGRRLWCAGCEVELTPTEEALIDCLFWHSPAVVGLDTLAHRIWHRSPGDRCRALMRVYVSYLRRKLNGSRRTAILTVRDVGYALRVD